MSHLPIDHSITFLGTRKLPETSWSYEEVLGLDLKVDRGSCRINRFGTEARLGFCQRDDLPTTEIGPGAGLVIFTLLTDEVEAWFEHFVAHGVSPVAKSSVNTRYSIYHFFLRDPNGYAMELQRFRHTFLRDAGSCGGH